MRAIVKTGVLIGLVVALWTLMMGVTGWYRHPVLNFLFLGVIVLEIWLLARGLRDTAPEATWGEQIVNGTLMCAVAAPIIFLGSLLFTTVLFPDYFRDVDRMARQVMQQQGMTGAEIEEQMSALAPTQTPLVQATFAAIGAIVTGLVASAVIGAFVRRRAGGSLGR